MSIFASFDPAQFSVKLDTATGRYSTVVTTAEEYPVDENQMAVWVPFSDGNTIDGVGDIVEVSGIDTTRHIRNPIVGLDHFKSVPLPIGISENPKTKQYTVEIDPVKKVAKGLCFFYRGTGMTGVDKQKEYDHAVLASQVFDLWVKKYLRSGSFGYTVQQADHLPPYRRNSDGSPVGLHLKKTLLLEYSIVVLPANQSTTRKSLDLGDAARRILCMNGVCGRPLSPVLVKSLQPYAAANTKVQVGFDSKAQPPPETPRGWDSVGTEVEDDSSDEFILPEGSLGHEVIDLADLPPTPKRKTPPANPETKRGNREKKRQWRKGEKALADTRDAEEIAPGYFVDPATGRRVRSRSIGPRPIQRGQQHESAEMQDYNKRRAAELKRQRAEIHRNQKDDENWDTQHIEDLRQEAGESRRRFVPGTPADYEEPPFSEEEQRRIRTATRWGRREMRGVIRAGDQQQAIEIRDARHAAQTPEQTEREIHQQNLHRQSGEAQARKIRKNAKDLLGSPSGDPADNELTRLSGTRRQLPTGDLSETHLPPQIAEPGYVQSPGYIQRVKALRALYRRKSLQLGDYVKTPDGATGVVGERTARHKRRGTVPVHLNQKTKKGGKTTTYELPEESLIPTTDGAGNRSIREPGPKVTRMRKKSVSPLAEGAVEQSRRTGERMHGYRHTGQKPKPPLRHSFKDPPQSMEEMQEDDWDKEEPINEHSPVTEEDKAAKEAKRQSEKKRAAAKKRYETRRGIEKTEEMYPREDGTKSLKKTQRTGTRKKKIVHSDKRQRQRGDLLEEAPKHERRESIIKRNYGKGEAKSLPPDGVKMRQEDMDASYESGRNERAEREGAKAYTKSSPTFFGDEEWVEQEKEEHHIKSLRRKYGGKGYGLLDPAVGLLQRIYRGYERLAKVGYGVADRVARDPNLSTANDPDSERRPPPQEQRERRMATPKPTPKPASQTGLNQAAFENWRRDQQARGGPGVTPTPKNPRKTPPDNGVKSLRAFYGKKALRRVVASPRRESMWGTREPGEELPSESLREVTGKNRFRRLVAAEAAERAARESAKKKIKEEDIPPEEGENLSPEQLEMHPLPTGKRRRTALLTPDDEIHPSPEDVNEGAVEMSREHRHREQERRQNRSNKKSLPTQKKALGRSGKQNAAARQNLARKLRAQGLTPDQVRREVYRQSQAARRELISQRQQEPIHAYEPPADTSEQTEEAPPPPEHGLRIYREKQLALLKKMFEEQNKNMEQLLDGNKAGPSVELKPQDVRPSEVLEYSESDPRHPFHTGRPMAVNPRTGAEKVRDTAQLHGRDRRAQAAILQDERYRRQQEMRQAKQQAREARKRVEESGGSSTAADLAEEETMQNRPQARIRRERLAALRKKQGYGEDPVHEYKPTSTARNIAKRNQDQTKRAVHDEYVERQIGLGRVDAPQYGGGPYLVGRERAGRLGQLRTSDAESLGVPRGPGRQAGDAERQDMADLIRPRQSVPTPSPKKPPGVKKLPNEGEKQLALLKKMFEDQNSAIEVLTKNITSLENRI